MPRRRTSKRPLSESQLVLAKLLDSPKWEPFDEAQLLRLDKKDLIALYESLDDIYEPHRRNRRAQLVAFDARLHAETVESTPRGTPP